MKTTIYLLGIVLSFSACETVINPTLQPADPQYIIDAFINNKPEMQVIHISLTQPYFEDQLPPPVSGAIVTITDTKGNVFPFPENPLLPGDYVWFPGPTGFGETGVTYTLSVNINGDVISAVTKMGRVPPIDSITFKTNPRVNESGEYYTGEFWAMDPKGPGDTYWIKAYKNGVLMNQPKEINLAYDAAFSKGAAYDGYEFIQPIRNGINQYDTDSKNHLISPYEAGDSVFVEIHSLSEACFNFMTQVVTETNRPGGFSELFARPLSNVSTNMTKETAGGTPVQGFFNVAAVSSLGRRYTP